MYAGDFFLLLASGRGQVFKRRHRRDVNSSVRPPVRVPGKKYSEGDDLPTGRLCLSCKCTADFMEPNDRHCSVIQCPQTNHLQLGCMPVYDDNGCCPVDWKCGEKDKCEKRFMRHYEAKGCTPLYEEGSECPVRFNCPKDVRLNDTACQFKGRLYAKGEDIDTGNPCQICSCQQDWDDKGVDIQCISVECPSVFAPPLNDSCRAVYEEGKCCSVRTDCDTEADEQKPVQTCEHGGKTYRLGEKIYPEEDPCLICRCTEEWTGILGNSCKVHDCALERDRKQLLKGCLPIYHEATCCPIEFFCGTPEEGFVNPVIPYVSQEDLKSNMTCVFKGAHYKVGDVLDFHHPTSCVTCKCTTPPDLTCVHRSCPRPPNDDYENCHPSYNPGQCCPTYDCDHRLMARAPTPHCSPVQCSAGCSVVTVHNSCPFCQCQEKLCSPPSCAPECTLQILEGQCPQCNCLDTVQAQIACSPVKCPAHCHEVVSSLGCPVCVCGPLCTPPKCEAGCWVKRDVPQGECPGCECDDNQEIRGMQCSPVKCPAACREAIGQSGCPACVCDTLCSPPKCEPGCEVDTSPQPLGSCPGCTCADQDPLPRLQCSPVKCGPLCHEAYDGNGCPTCICDPLCSPPVCEEGCTLKHDDALGPCPTCKCESGGEGSCPRVSCGPQCEKVVASDGCPTCSCGALCSNPRCEAGCHLEFDNTAGPCAACVCPPPKLSDPVISCSVPKCEADCTVDYSAEPCPACTCGVSSGIQCSPPKCEEGCRIDYSAHPCPACACNDTQPAIPILQCSPPKCDEGCRIDYNAKPCPACTCIRRSPSRRPQCSTPQCPSGCSVDYGAVPCPTCVCAVEPRSGIQCSMPRCEAGCEINHNATPCPTCVCESKTVSCSPPKCDPGCQVDMSAKPCPACVCLSVPQSGILCSPPKCREGCRIDYNAKPCPVCICDGSTAGVSDILCSPPKCDAGCKINYDSRPCPSCSCGEAPPPTGAPFSLLFIYLFIYLLIKHCIE
ncbi:uncharacterized protein CEXT_548651 [Caerostris extrusa]|uniref:VWFC domain-containing protein n=1 Tax=Caerostris extrusa TaxID=172846 RepID=A0AAV4P313_CAEEX|nr:uncharacterized protein CEXT_548651 [Caerostris extrusa]